MGNQQIALSCRESQLLLRAISPDKEYSAMTEEEQSAIRHYYSYDMCRHCKEIGLTKILSIELSCQEALEKWAEKPGPLYQGSGVTTLREILAVEHVWGKMLATTVDEKERIGLAYRNNIDNCKSKACIELMCYWMRAPLSIFYDGGREIAEQIPFLISLFKEEGWSLDKLLQIQTDRINKVLNSIVTGKNLDNYHSKSDAVYEVRKNIEVLQALAINKKKKS